MKIFLVMVVALVLSSPTSGVAAASTGPGLDPAAVERFVSAYRERTGLPGVAIAVTHGAQVVYTAGFGHDATGAAVTGTTRMPIASLSKSFTALAVLQLAESGKVDLDMPVHRYL